MAHVLTGVHSAEHCCVCYSQVPRPQQCDISDVLGLRRQPAIDSHNRIKHNATEVHASATSDQEPVQGGYLLIEGVEGELSGVVSAAHSSHVPAYHAGVCLTIILTVPLTILLNNLHSQERFLTLCILRMRHQDDCNMVLPQACTMLCLTKS